MASGWSGVAYKTDPAFSRVGSGHSLENDELVFGQWRAVLQGPGHPDVAETDSLEH